MPSVRPAEAVAAYADLVAERDALADRGRAIEQELVGLRETVVPELRESGVTRLAAKNGREVTMWAERDPEDGSLNVEWTIAESVQSYGVPATNAIECGTGRAVAD
jgi:hypothetical protein